VNFRPNLNDKSQSLNRIVNEESAEPTKADLKKDIGDS
jgi:hypothetical protein